MYLSCHFGLFVSFVAKEEHLGPFLHHFKSLIDSLLLKTLEWGKTIDVIDEDNSIGFPEKVQDETPIFFKASDVPDVHISVNILFDGPIILLMKKIKPEHIPPKWTQ